VFAIGIYRAFFKLVLMRIPAEAAHALAEATMRFLARLPGYLWLSDRLLGPRDDSLRVRVGELELRGPLGVAAGVDKNAKWFDPLTALGFGFVEVGTVTAHAQRGNEEHRRVVTRLPRDRALLNAMGFPNDGARAVAARLARRRADRTIGVNIGKTRSVDLEHAVADYRESARLLAPVADYLVLNVSSPNTPGLTRLQDLDRLTALVEGVREELGRQGVGNLPLMVKLSPDLADAEIEAIAEMALRLGLAGIVAVNTTTDYRTATGSSRELAAQQHDGGLSGPPLRDRAVEVLRILRARTGGRIPLVSVGGIETPEDAWQRILAGATLLQVYTGLVYAGPLWARRMNRGIARRLRESEWSSLEEALGSDSGAKARLEVEVNLGKKGSGSLARP
jgi:dihydroorotate dehydrogenase